MIPMKRFLTLFLVALSFTQCMAQSLEAQLSGALNLYAKAVAAHDMMTIRGLIPMDFTLEHMDGQTLDRAAFLKGLERRNDFVRKVQMSAKLSNVKRDGQTATAVMVLTTRGEFKDENSKVMRLVATETSVVTWRQVGGVWEMTRIVVNEIEQRIDGKVVGRVKRPA